METTKGPHPNSVAGRAAAPFSRVLREQARLLFIDVLPDVWKMFVESVGGVLHILAWALACVLFPVTVPVLALMSRNRWRAQMVQDDASRDRDPMYRRNALGIWVRARRAAAR